MNKHVINLDLHGGDFAPSSVLEGASMALSKNPSIVILQITKEKSKNLLVIKMLMLINSIYSKKINYLG